MFGADAKIGALLIFYFRSCEIGVHLHAADSNAVIYCHMLKPFLQKNAALDSPAVQRSPYLMKSLHLWLFTALSHATALALFGCECLHQHVHAEANTGSVRVFLGTFDEIKILFGFNMAERGEKPLKFGQKLIDLALI